MNSSSLLFILMLKTSNNGHTEHASQTDYVNFLKHGDDLYFHILDQLRISMDG